MGVDRSTDMLNEPADPIDHRSMTMHAKNRGVVVLSDGRTARLFHWPNPAPISGAPSVPAKRRSRGRRAVVELQSGAKLSVEPASLRILPEPAPLTAPPAVEVVPARDPE